MANHLDGTFTELLWSVGLARLLAGLIIFGVIGLEREHRGKPADLRTHLPVC